MQQHPVEECIDVSALETVEDIVDELQDLHWERISEQIIEEDEDTLLRPIREEHDKVVNLDTGTSSAD